MHNLIRSRGTQRLELPDGSLQFVGGSERPRTFDANLNRGCGGLSLCWITGFLGKYPTWDNCEGGKKD
jgi:hypothetical protein